MGSSSGNLVIFTPFHRMTSQNISTNEGNSHTTPNLTTPVNNNVMFLSSNQRSPFSNPNFIIFQRGTIQRRPPFETQPNNFSNSSATTNQNNFPILNNLNDIFSNNNQSQNNETGGSHQFHFHDNLMEEDKKEEKKQTSFKQNLKSTEHNKSSGYNPHNQPDHSNPNITHNTNLNSALSEILSPLLMNFGININNIFTQVFSNNSEMPYHPAFIHLRMNEFANNYNNNFGIPIPIDPSDQSHPVSKEILDKLKIISLSSEHCKKNAKGNLEFPNCAICCSNISLNQRAIILECGHIYHFDCVNTWFKTHNTCPLCRREIH